MKTSHLGLALSLLTGVPSLAHADPTDFLNTPSAPINPVGLDFELRSASGKATFQQGETIPVTLLFSNRGTQTLGLNTFHFPPPSLAVFGFFKAAPADGVTNPLGDLPPETSFSIAGRGPDRPQILGKKPVEIPLVLNEYLRFDHPGTYEIRATTNRVFAVEEGKTTPRQGSLFGSNTSVTSTPLSIEIVPADPQWQQEQVVAWRAYWAKLQPDYMGWRNPEGVQSPTNELRYLSTRTAAQAIIDRLGQDEFPRSSGSEAYYSWRSGLIGFSERLWLIGAMKDALKRPDYPVTEGFLDNLATLQALYHVARAGQKTPPEQFAQAGEKANLANWQLTQASLSAKKGRARAMTVHSLLELGWLSALAKEAAVQRQLPRLVAMVPDIFSDLPALPQQYLLDDKFGHKEWSLIKSPRIIAPLVQAWQAVPYVEGGSKELGNLILRHLYELDPKVARPLILEEMVAPHPRASLEVLSLLPDKSLPQLESIWWTNFNKGINQDTTIRLARRYATSALKAKFHSRYQIKL